MADNMPYVYLNISHIYIFIYQMIHNSIPHIFYQLHLIYIQYHMIYIYLYFIYHIQHNCLGNIFHLLAYRAVYMLYILTFRIIGRFYLILCSFLAPPIYTHPHIDSTNHLFNYNLYNF